MQQFPSFNHTSNEILIEPESVNGSNKAFNEEAFLEAIGEVAHYAFTLEMLEKRQEWDLQDIHECLLRIFRTVTFSDEQKTGMTFGLIRELLREY